MKDSILYYISGNSMSFVSTAVKYCDKYFSYVYNQHVIIQYFLSKQTKARTVEDKSIMQPSLCRIGELAYIKDPCEVNNICGLGALYLLFPRKQSVSEPHD